MPSLICLVSGPSGFAGQPPGDHVPCQTSHHAPGAAHLLVLCGGPVSSAPAPHQRRLLALGPPRALLPGGAGGRQQPPGARRQRGATGVLQVLFVVSGAGWPGAGPGHRGDPQRRGPGWELAVGGAGAGSPGAAPLQGVGNRLGVRVQHGRKRRPGQLGAGGGGGAWGRRSAAKRAERREPVGLFGGRDGCVAVLWELHKLLKSQNLEDCDYWCLPLDTASTHHHFISDL